MPKKRNFRRAVSLLIAFLFILECFPARTFAASAPALTYSIDVEGAKETGGTNVFYANQRGDTVTVRFTMSRTDAQGNYSLNTMQNEIEYDMSFFEFVESSISVDKSGVDAEMQTRVMGQEIVKVSALNGSEFASEQAMCSFRLKIKSDAESDSGWVRCSEAKAVATDYASATVTERNLEVRLKQSGLTVTATGYDNAYDGEEHAVSATPNVTDGTTVEYSVDNGANWSETAPSLKDAGTVAVKVRAKNDAYFDATADAELKITPKALTVTANAASKTFGDADPDLTYSADGLVSGDSVSGTLERAAGENAGTYAISQGTLSAGDNYAVSFQGANFTISPKDISAASISLSAHTLTYTGAEQNVSVNAVTLDGATLTETDYAVSGDTRGTNVGSFTVTVTGQGNYTGSASVEWNIVTAGMNAKAENVSVTYDKQPHGITVTGAPSGATITYSTDNATYSETNPSFTDAGARVVYYKIMASGYDEFTGSATVTIAKRPVVVSGIAAQSKTYDGNANATLIYDEVTFDGIIDGDSLTVTASGAFDSADAGENKTVAITGLALGGDAASNYELASEGQQASASANITPADMTVTATGYEGVYDRKPHSPAVDAPDGAEILWSDAANGTYAAETPSFIDAGTYTAYYRVQRANYQTVSGSVTVTIAQKSVEGATILLEQNEFIYDGETKTAVVQMVTLPDGDILSETDYSVSDNQTANAGYYLLTVTGQGNYKDTAKVSWTIRNAGASGISAANISTTYDGNPRSISVVGAPDGATITYSTDGETYSGTNPEYTDAGTSQTVYYRVTATNYDEFNGSATITIAKRPVTVSGITAANKAYDGNVNATLIYDGVTFNGIVDGDELSVSATGTFADAEVGDGKTVNITNLTLGGKSVGNYQLLANGQQTETTASITANALTVTASGYSGVYDGAAHGITVNAPDGATVTYSETESGTYGAENPTYQNAGTYTVFYKVTMTGSTDVGGSETVTISKKDIVISGITAANKPYDGNTDATLDYSGVTFIGIVDGDELTVTASGTFADAEVGNAKAVSITNLTLNGTDAGNYQLAASGQQTATTANITANPLNVTSSGYSGVYDGAAHGITLNAPDGATVTYSETESGTYGAENPAYKNAGTYTVFYKVTLTGSDDVSGSQTVNISRKEIVVSGITAANKAYDGNTNATLIYDNVTFNGIISGDELTVSATGTFADAETGNGKTVSITNLTLGGASVGNYQLAASGQQTETTASITANALNVTASGYSGVYDGTAHGITVNAPDGATVTYSESESGTYGAENPAYKNAGTYTVFYKVTLTGSDDVSGGQTVNISRKEIVVSGITAANKAYDGNTDATLNYSGVTFNGIVDGDELTVTGTGTFENAEIGNAKTVNITNLTLGGADAGNYQLLANGQQTETTANITANALNVTANGYSGVYDGEFHGITVNAPSGATVTYSETENGTYGAENPAYKNAGTYTVFYKVTLTGSDDVSGSQTVNISRKEIIVSGIAATNKPYDGNTDATLIYDNVTFNGIISGDELTVSATGTFADAEIGNAKTVNITNLTLGGASVGNYQLAANGQQTETTANITANALDVTASGYSGVYDGEFHGITVNAPSGATVTYSESESGTYGAENPTYTNAGNYTVFYKVTLVGSDDVSGSQTVRISRKEIVVSGITAANKSYDGNTNATLIYDNVTFDGIISGDELTVTGTGTFENAEVGSGKTVSVTNLTLGGASVGNYQLAANGQQTETTANITANALDVTASGYSGVYDGEFHGITVNAPSGATVTYSESESGAYGAENPTYKNAGTYTVYYKVSMTGYADVTGSAVVSISKATLTLSLTMVDRSNPNQLRNAWPYADIPSVPSMSARRGVTEVSDYGLTVYSYKSLSGSEYLPYSAEVVESLPVGAYVLRVTVGENRNYLSAETETGFSIEKAVHNDVSAEPLNVVGGERGLFVSLESYLEEGYECAVSEFEGGLFSGEPVMDGGVLRFDTAASNETGVVRVTVSSANYEDYTITVTLKASSALTLRFDANGGSEVTTVKSLLPGEPYGTLPASTRTGYALQGWFTAMTDGEQADASSVMGYADTFLYARWTKLDYTVTLILNGGGLPDGAAGWTVSGDSATFVFHVDSETFMLPEAVMAGYTFAGWTAPGQSVGQAVLEVTVSQGTTENLTYAANWTEGERIGVVEFEKPDDGSGILGVLDLTQESGESDAQKSDTDADEYPATSLAKALKEIACADETQVEETQTKDVTVSMSLRALSDLTDADETALDEASKQSKREQGQIKDAARETFGNDDTLKSDFLSIDLEKIVTVKDDGGGESRESDAMRVSPKVLEIPLRYNLTGRYNPVVFRFHDAAAALRRLSSRPRNYQSMGNGFDGSFYVSGAGNDAVIYIYTSRFSSYSVTTSGVESWTVLFDTDGGTAIPHQSVATAGERKVTRPSNPVKDGYTFVGWYVSDNGEEKPFDFDAPISGDVTIYAKWTENAPVTPVTPSYSGGGSGSGPRSYRIEVADAEHGSVKVSAKTATNGQKVTVTVTPESGYLTDSVTVRTAADKNVALTKSGTNVFRFTMPANDVTVSAVFAKQDADSGDTETETPPDNGDSETDSNEVAGPLSPDETGVSDWLIADTHPAYIGGFSDGTFRPESNITRAQAAMMFYRLLKNKTATKTVTFKDMNGSEWYAEAVYTLAGFDIIRGYSDGSFHGNDGISRAAFTAIAIRLAKKTVPDNAERFSDVPSGHWARETIARASDYGWIGGYSDGTFHPSAPITRAAVTAIINRMLNRNADEEYVAQHYTELNRFSDVTDSNAWYYYNVMEASNAHGFTVSEGKERWNG